MKKNRILVIASSQHFVDIFLLDFLHKISKKNKIYIITNFEDKYKHNDSIKRYHISINRKISPFSDLYCLISIFSKIIKIKPNLIITATPKSIIFGIFLRFVLWKLKRIHIYTGLTWTNMTSLKKILFTTLDKINIYCSDRLLVDSQNQINFLKINRFNINKFYLIGNGSIKGVDLNIFYKYGREKKIKLRNHYKIPENFKIILYLGRMDPDKGLDVLIHSFRNLMRSNSKILLLLVGRDEMNIHQYLKENFRDISEFIRLIPHNDRPQDMYNLSDIFCIPSRREGFGNVVIESSSCSIPVIGSDIQGLSSSLINNFNGLTFKVDDIDDLSSKIQTLINDENLCHRLGINGRKFVLENFNKKFVYQSLEKLISIN